MDFTQKVKNIKLQKDECMSSYDVKTLLTSVPTEPDIKITKEKMEQDKELPLRISMTVGNIIIMFQGNYYEQVEGVAMGSPISPIVANLFMET